MIMSPHFLAGFQAAELSYDATKNIQELRKITATSEKWDNIYHILKLILLFLLEASKVHNFHHQSSRVAACCACRHSLPVSHIPSGPCSPAQYPSMDTKAASPFLVSPLAVSSSDASCAQPTHFHHLLQPRPSTPTSFLKAGPRKLTSYATIYPPPRN